MPRRTQRPYASICATRRRTTSSARAIDGYEAARCLLSEPAARALAAVQADLAAAGLGLLVFDCYRPQRAVDHFVRWSAEPADPALAARHHPNVPKGELIARGYIAPRSGHSRGEHRRRRPVRLGDGEALDLGTPFDFFDARSHVRCRRVRARASEPRATRRGDGAPRLRALRARVVALHAARRTVAGSVLRPGRAIACARAAHPARPDARALARDSRAPAAAREPRGRRRSACSTSRRRAATSSSTGSRSVSRAPAPASAATRSPPSRSPRPSTCASRSRSSAAR